METVLCAAVDTASHQHGLEKLVLCMETLLCAAVGTASHQNVTDAGTTCDRYGTMLKKDKAVLKKTQKSW
jgi:hypothetical protein